MQIKYVAQGNNILLPGFEPSTYVTRYRHSNQTTNMLNPTEYDEERLNQHLHKNSRLTTRETADKIKCFNTAIEKHLHSMGKVQKCGAWVPYALSDNNKINEPQSRLVSLLVTAQLMDTSNEFFTEW